VRANRGFSAWAPIPGTTSTAARARGRPAVDGAGLVGWPAVAWPLSGKRPLGAAKRPNLDHIFDVAAFAAGGSACKPRILGMGADSGRHEHRSPSTRVATKAGGWRSTFRRSIARLVPQPGQNTSSHGVPRDERGPDRGRPMRQHRPNRGALPLSNARACGNEIGAAPARITRATTPSPPCRGLPIRPAFARRLRSPAGESIVDLARTFGVDGAAPYRVQAAARP
jgi:hypothetical protein